MTDQEIIKEMVVQINQIKQHTPELTKEELEEIINLVVNESEDIPQNEKEELITGLLKVI